MKLCTFDDSLSVGKTCSRESITAPGYSGADFCCRVAADGYPAAVLLVMLSLCGIDCLAQAIRKQPRKLGSLIWKKANIFRGLKGLLRVIDSTGFPKG